jgi:thioredoxin 1
MNKLNFLLALILIVNASCTAQNEQALLPKDFKAKMNQPSVVILDVRTPEEFTDGHLDKAINLDIKNDQFESQCDKLDKSKPVLVYCFSDKRSTRAAEMLRLKGFDAIVLKGGIEAWQQGGLPVVKGNK